MPQFFIFISFLSFTWTVSATPHPCAADVAKFGGGFSLSEIERHGHREFDQNLGEVSSSCREFMVELLSRSNSCVREAVQLCPGKGLNSSNRKKCLSKQEKLLSPACREQITRPVEVSVPGCQKKFEADCPAGADFAMCREKYLTTRQLPGMDCRPLLRKSWLHKRILAELAPVGVSWVDLCAEELKVTSCMSQGAGVFRCLRTSSVKFGKQCRRVLSTHQSLESCRGDIADGCEFTSETLLSCLRKKGPALGQACAMALKTLPAGTP